MFGFVSGCHTELCHFWVYLGSGWMYFRIFLIFAFRGFGFLMSVCLDLDFWVYVLDSRWFLVFMVGWFVIDLKLCVG